MDIFWQKKVLAIISANPEHMLLMLLTIMPYVTSNEVKLMNGNFLFPFFLTDLGHK